MADPRLPPTWKNDCAKAVASARGQARDARGFRMEHRRSRADQCRGEQQQAETVGEREQQQAGQREAHADGQRIRHRPAIGVPADQRLQQRRGDLVGEREQADLAEIQRVMRLQQRIDRRQQRLDHVVEEMAEADGGEHLQYRVRGAAAHRGLVAFIEGIRQSKRRLSQETPQRHAFRKPPAHPQRRHARATARAPRACARGRVRSGPRRGGIRRTRRRCAESTRPDPAAARRA